MLVTAICLYNADSKSTAIFFKCENKEKHMPTFTLSSVMVLVMAMSCFEPPVCTTWDEANDDLRDILS